VKVTAEAPTFGANGADISISDASADLLKQFLIHDHHANDFFGALLTVFQGAQYAFTIHHDRNSYRFNLTIGGILPPNDMGVISQNTRITPAYAQRIMLERFLITAAILGQTLRPTRKYEHS
jgi:hypothetical protein